MVNYELFPDVDYPQVGDYQYAGIHYHVTAEPGFVHDTFKVKRCVPINENLNEFDRHLGYLELCPDGWSAVSSLSAIPSQRQMSKPARSWQDALIRWY